MYKMYAQNKKTASQSTAVLTANDKQKLFFFLELAVCMMVDLRTPADLRNDGSSTKP